MRTKEFFTVVGLLFAVGLSIFTYRSIVLGFPLLPNQSVESWHVEAKLDLNGTGNKPVRLDFFLPLSTDRHTVVDENFVSNGFGLTSRKLPQTQNRLASWTKRNPEKREILYYRAILYETRSTNAEAGIKPKIGVPQIGSAEFKVLSQEQTSYFALESVINELRARSADDETFSLELFQFLKANHLDDRFVQLRDQNEALKNDAALAVYVLQHAGIPARVMNGVPLTRTSRHIRLMSWPQIYLKGHWLSYDDTLHALKMTTDRLQWWVGNKPFYTADNGAAPSLSVSVKQHTENALTEAMWQGDSKREAVYKMSIFNLPIDVQLVFMILLPIPLGALVVCLMRQVIGVQTFGTFMPILVALAFRETQLLWGIIFFTTIAGMGLIFRGYLNRLQLLLVPRLTAIMILVVLSIYLLSVITFNLNIHSGLSISLFPLVILTMLIERLSITCEEYGVPEALKSAFGSLVVAVLSYLVMNNSILSHLMVSFPELLMIVLAATLLIGRYNGYKLTEYYRFRAATRSLQDKA